jgi:hypothetical protein
MAGRKRKIGIGEEGKKITVPLLIYIKIIEAGQVGTGRKK